MIESETPKAIKKRVRGDPMARLARASARVLRDNSDAIVKAVFDNAIVGNTASAKLLLALVDKVPSRRRPKTLDRAHD